MAATRKLQAEIDRCLKKVSEGVELFEEVWLKVHNATNPNQKEKYESDLKKEIKKLQRLRDQIKTWIASGEIKDKSTLIETRKLIETQMERFKVVERETKTKAYSKEGLGLVVKTDPLTRERDELNTWLINTIDFIQVQMDTFENDIDQLLVFKKKKLDKERQTQVDNLKHVIERHKFHLTKLELILRTLDNLTCEEKLPLFLSQVKKIKEDVEYYLDSAQDPEYQDNEFLYDDIDGLEELSGSGIGSSTISPTPTPTMDSNPTTPTTSTGTLTPYLPPVEQQILNQKLQQPQQHHHGFPERRKSYTEETKIVKPLPVKASGSVGGGGYGAGKFYPRSNNVSPIVPNCLDTSETGVDHPGKVVQENQILTLTPPNVECGDSEPNNIISFPSELESRSWKPRPQPLPPYDTNYKKSNFVRTSSPPPFFPKQVSVPQTQSSEPVHASSTPTNVTYSSNGLTLQQPPRPPSQPHSDPQPLPPVEKNEGLIDIPIMLPSMNSNTNHLLSPSAGVRLMSSSTVIVTNMAKPKALVRTESASTLPPVLNCNHPLNVNPDCMIASSIPIQETQTSEQEVVLPQQLQTQQSQPPQQNQPQQPVSNAPHLRLIGSSHEHTMMDQYIGGNESNPLDTQLTTLKSMAQEVMTRAGLNFATDQRGGVEVTTSAHIPPLLGVAPLGPVPLLPKHEYQLTMLESAHYHMPCSADSEPLRQYLPRNPIPTPNYYPQSPLLNSDSLDFFGRLSIETLFFIFYYLEGTRAQYMAAKVLKKQSWRFHTKFMMWFQRHEEPKVINEVYEQGTYIYFDIEKWGQRKKDGFVFEYQYLEDRELN